MHTASLAQDPIRPKRATDKDALPSARCTGKWPEAQFDDNSADIGGSADIAGNVDTKGNSGQYGSERPRVSSEKENPSIQGRDSAGKNRERNSGRRADGTDDEVGPRAGRRAQQTTAGKSSALHLLRCGSSQLGRERGRQ